MAQNKIEIVITADGKKASATLTTTGKEVKGLGDATKQANSSTASFGKGLMSVQSALAGLGLGVTVSQLVQFGVESFKAAAAAERLGTATSNLAQDIGETGESMVSSITAASLETISRTDAMSAANKAMMFGLVENSDQMARLTEVAITLGAAMGQDAGKSLDDLTTALGRQSPMILDNLGITLKLEEAYRIYADQLGKSVEALTEQEKKQAFVNAALIKGEERVKALGGVSIDTAGKTEQLGAAWADFTVAFGGLMTEMSGGIETLTAFVRKLEEGAQAWKQIFADMSTIKEYNMEIAEADRATVSTIQALTGVSDAYIASTGAVEESVAATRQKAQADEQATRLAGMYAESNRLIAETSEQERLAVEGTTEAVRSSADIHVLSGAEAAAAYKEIGEAAMAAAEEAREAQMSLASSQADFILSFREMNEERLTNESDFSARMSEIRGGAAEKSKEAATALSEELAKIEQERADKLHWVMTGAHARTAEENAAALAHWNAHYDELTATATAKSKEKTDAILAEQSRAEAAAAAAREKEKAEYQAHLEELKLQTALSMLETTGQLEQLTGLTGIKAGEAADLISAGILEVSEPLGMAIQDTMQNMESSMSAASETASANQAILQEAMAGTLTGAQGLGTGATEALTMIGDQTTALREEQTVPYREELELISSETVPTLTETYVSGMDQSVAATDRLIAKLPELISALKKTTAAAKELTDTLVSGINAVAKGIDKAASNLTDKLIPNIKKTAKEMEILESIARRTFETMTTTGSVAGDITGEGFQHGTPPGGFLVPPSFGVDQFIARFSGGERIFAYPDGGRPEQNRTVNNYFNQTINANNYDSRLANSDLRTMQLLV